MPGSRGGRAAQSGFYYQNSIAALYLGQLLSNDIERLDSERVVHVHVESADKVDDIVITFFDQHKLYIQAKENISVSGEQWSNLWHKLTEQYQVENFNKTTDCLQIYVGRENLIDVQEITIKASANDSYDEWVNQLTDKQKRLLEKIKKALPSKALGVLPSEILEGNSLRRFLSRIEVVIGSLGVIERTLAPNWMPKTNRTYKELFSLLRDKVGGNARIGKAFTANDLIKSLKDDTKDIEFVGHHSLDKFLAELKDVSALLLQHKSEFGDTGIHYTRPIVNDIVNWLESSASSEKNVAVLVDQAGMGKSVIMQDVVIESEARSLIAVALKADQQLQDISSVTEIQGKLGLSSPLERIIETASKLKRVVIIVDQLDALSLTLAHDEKALNVTLGLIARLRRIPNVRILISCRLFDLKSDPRLRTIDIEKPFTIPVLSEDEIKKTLSSMNIVFDSLSSATKVLLQTPLHLNLFAMAFSNKQIPAERFQGLISLQELYEALWNNVIFVFGRDIPSEADRRQVIDILVDYMDNKQKTTAPQSVFYNTDNNHLDVAVRWLASAGILLNKNANWTFLHQTFIDYCFARNFVERGRNIVQETLNSPQGLYERSKLIQVMTYLRGYEPTAYLSAYNQLINLPNLRFHLKDMLERWFGALPDPTEAEWQYLRKNLYSSDNIQPYFNALQGNRAWFVLLKERIIPNWLASDDDNFVNSVILYVSTLIDVPSCQKEIIHLLEPYIDRGDVWTGRLMSLFGYIRIWHSIETAEFFEKVIYHLASVNNHDWYVITNVAKTFPKLGCRLIYFAFEYTDKKEKSENQNIEHSWVKLHLLDNSSIDEVIKVACNEEPEIFLETLVPWLIRTLGEPKISDMRDYWFEGDMFSYSWNIEYKSVRPTFIYSIIHAMDILSKESTEKAAKYIEKFRDLPFTTPQRIIVHLYMNNPGIYAQNALTFFGDDARRFALGENDGYDSCKLISAIYPFLSQKERSKLEELILKYLPIYKHRKVDGLRHSGIEQLYLLRSIPLNFLSMTGQKRLSELERKFPNLPPLVERKMKGGGVGSPIPKENADRMSDQNWLTAMNKITGKYRNKMVLRGSAAELSGLLQSQIKESPKRFYQLLDKMSDDIDEYYALAFITGLSESKENSEWAFDAIQRFIPKISHPNKRAISWVIQKQPKNIPATLIEWLVTTLSSPMDEDEISWSKEGNSGDVFSSFLNSNRGAAFDTLIEVYRQQENKDAIVKQWELIEFAAQDPSIALHAGAIRQLTFLIRYDRNKAIDLFEKLASDDILFTLIYTREFVYWAFYKNFLRFYSYIVKMMNHDNDKARNQGAELACIAAISEQALEDNSLEKAEELALAAITGNVEWRRGAARIFAHNLANEAREICEKYLPMLLDDNDEQVRSHIDDIFYSLHEEHIYTLRSFIEAYSQTSHNLSNIFCEFMLKHGMLDPDWALKVLGYVVQNINMDKKQYWHIGADELIRLTLQIYSKSVDDKVRQDAMDIFDTLLKNFSGSAQKILSESDR